MVFFWMKTDSLYCSYLSTEEKRHRSYYYYEITIQ